MFHQEMLLGIFPKKYQTADQRRQRLAKRRSFPMRRQETNPEMMLQ
jgi:hypothetical protein